MVEVSIYNEKNKNVLSSEMKKLLPIRRCICVSVRKRYFPTVSVRA